MVGGLADGLLGPPSPRLPGDPVLERLLLCARDLGRPQGPARVPTPHPPPSPEDSSSGMRLTGVSWSLPLSATEASSGGSQLQLSSALRFSPPSIQRGHLKTQISLIAQWLRSFPGESQCPHQSHQTMGSQT